MLKTYSIFTINKHKIRQSIAALSMVLLIFGCSSSTQNTHSNSGQVTNEWRVNKSLLEKVRNFDITGKVSFKNKDQAISANFQWQQQGQNISLRLTNFFGATMLKLVHNQYGTTIIDHKGKTHKGGDSATLIASLTGVKLPISELANWLKALPLATNGYQLNKLNTLASLSQYAAPNQKLGWQISYPVYGRFANILLPKEIQMKDKTQQVSLSITNWRL